MTGKVMPDKGNDPIEGYAGTPPLKVDLVIFWFLKMLFGLCIFWMIYLLSIGRIRILFNYNYLVEIAYTLLWLFISDIIALVGAWIVKMLFLKEGNYIGTQKSHKSNMNRLVWQYFLYCIFRSIGYMFGITGALTMIFLQYLPVWYGFWAFLLAWIIISIISKILAFLMSAWITKSI